MTALTPATLGASLHAEDRNQPTDDRHDNPKGIPANSKTAASIKDAAAPEDEGNRKFILIVLWSTWAAWY
ncbi:MAG: hypothetical protein AAFR26_21650 [Cyanobacteria bacterium J06626_4]